MESPKVCLKPVSHWLSKPSGYLDTEIHMTVQDVMEGGHNHMGQLGTYDEGRRGDHMILTFFSAGSPSGNSWDNCNPDQRILQIQLGLNNLELTVFLVDTF